MFKTQIKTPCSWDRICPHLRQMASRNNY